MNFSTASPSSRCRSNSKREWQRHRQDQLDLMRRYAYGAGCRQQAIMDYFGDSDKLDRGLRPLRQLPDSRCHDRSMPRPRKPSASCFPAPPGWAAASAAASSPTWSRAAIQPRSGRYQHERLPTYGRLSSMTKRQVQSLIQALDPPGLSAQEGLRYPVLTVTDEGREVMHNRVQAR